MFNRVLIANRGEIAIRIARAAASLGIESVAVHAPIDALSLHAKLATQALEQAAMPAHCKCTWIGPVGRAVRAEKTLNRPRC